MNQLKDLLDYFKLQRIYEKNMKHFHLFLSGILRSHLTQLLQHDEIYIKY